MNNYQLESIVKQISKPYSPVDIVEFNNQILRVAIFEGDYHWHSHENEDEFFLVYKGSITIDTENGPINLSEGEGTVIPKGIKHKPSSKDRSVVLMIEPVILKSQGD